MRPNTSIKRSSVALLWNSAWRSMPTARQSAGYGEARSGAAVNLPPDTVAAPWSRDGRLERTADVLQSSSRPVRKTGRQLAEAATLSRSLM